MSWFWDLLLISTVSVWALNWGFRTGAPPVSIMYLLVGLVAFVAFARVNGSYSRLIRATFRIAMPLAALAAFGLSYGWKRLSGLVVIITMLFAFYLIFSGFRHVRLRR